MRRGTPVMQAYADRLEAERLAQHNIGRCAWCPDFRVEGTLAETREALRAHRQAVHPDVIPKRRHKRHATPMHTLGTKNLDDNIAAARQQGAATWEGAA